MRIIALTGWSESGKDTVADILVSEYNFKKYAIASPLKDLCASLYGFPRELADTHEGKKTIWRVGYKNKTIREILLDTAILDRSRFGDDIYVNKILDQISSEKPSSVVITDLRYFTELTAIHKYVKTYGDSLEVWKVLREDQKESPVKDISEHSIESVKPHWIIENDGKSLETLKQKVSEAMSRNHVLSNTQNEDDGCRIM